MYYHEVGLNLKLFITFLEQKKEPWPIFYHRVYKVESREGVRSPRDPLSLKWNNCLCGAMKSLVFEKFAQCPFPNLISIAVVHGAAHSSNHIIVSCYHPAVHQPAACCSPENSTHIFFLFIFLSPTGQSVHMALVSRFSS